VAGGQRVDAPYVPYKNARAGRRGGERREKRGERVRGGGRGGADRGGEEGNGDRTLEKRRRSGWVRWRRPGYPGRSSAANRDKEGSGPWAGDPPRSGHGPAGFAIAVFFIIFRKNYFNFQKKNEKIWIVRNILFFYQGWNI